MKNKTQKTPILLTSMKLCNYNMAVISSRSSQSEFIRS